MNVLDYNLGGKVFQIQHGSFSIYTVKKIVSIVQEKIKKNKNDIEININEMELNIPDDQEIIRCILGIGFIYKSKDRSKQFALINSIEINNSVIKCNVNEEFSNLVLSK